MLFIGGIAVEPAGYIILLSGLVFVSGIFGYLNLQNPIILFGLMIYVLNVLMCGYEILSCNMQLKKIKGGYSE